MKPFAKLYYSDELALMQGVEDGPEISIYVDPGIPGVGVCKTGIGFGDEEGGWDKADKAFDLFDDEAALKIARKLIANIRQMLEEA